MNIGFYGHSAASWYGDNRSFIDQIKNKLGAKIVNIGVRQGSQERILFDLKKTKNLDIAIIFHAWGEKYSFFPKCNRDLSVDIVPENKAKIFWSLTVEHQATGVNPNNITDEGNALIADKLLKLINEF